MKTEISELMKELESCRGKYAFINFVSNAYAISKDFSSTISACTKNRRDVKVVNIYNYICPVAFQHYNVSSYPYVLVMDKEGEICRIIREEKSPEKILELIRTY